MTVLVSVLAGSKLYGLDTPESDTDIRTVYAERRDQIFGISEAKQRHKKESDIVEYPLKDFVRLAVAGNPNILDILFAAPAYWQESSPSWETLYSNRHVFLSQHIRESFLGYASQALHNVKAGKSINGNRQHLIDAHGYDTKDASHVLRLLINYRSIAHTETYNPTLKGELHALVVGMKRGVYSHTEAVKLLTDWFDACRGLELGLPAEPNVAYINHMLYTIYTNLFGLIKVL